MQKVKIGMQLINKLLKPTFMRNKIVKIIKNKNKKPCLVLQPSVDEFYMIVLAAGNYGIS